MTRAEQFACKYAGLEHSPTRRDKPEERERCDIYYACLEAYEQAEKDLIEKAVTWWSNNLVESEPTKGYYISAFKKYMEKTSKKI